MWNLKYYLLEIYQWSKNPKINVYWWWTITAPLSRIFEYQYLTVAYELCTIMVLPYCRLCRHILSGTKTVDHVKQKSTSLTTYCRSLLDKMLVLQKTRKNYVNWNFLEVNYWTANAHLGISAFCNTYDNWNYWMFYERWIPLRQTSLSAGNSSVHRLIHCHANPSFES